MHPHPTRFYQGRLKGPEPGGIPDPGCIDGRRGGFLRHGRSGIFRDQRAMIDFDMRRYSSHGNKSQKSERVLAAAYGEVLGRVVQIYGVMV